MWPDVIVAAWAPAKKAFHLYAQMFGKMRGALALFYDDETMAVARAEAAWSTALGEWILPYAAVRDAADPAAALRAVCDRGPDGTGRVDLARTETSGYLMTTLDVGDSLRCKMRRREIAFDGPAAPQ